MLDLGSLMLQVGTTITLEGVSPSLVSNYSSALIQIAFPPSVVATPPESALLQGLTSSLQTLLNNSSSGGVVLGGLEIFSPPGIKLGYQGFYNASE